MIQPKELRLGNYFITEHQIFQVDKITPKGINIPSNNYGLDIQNEDIMFSLEDIEPIPLTEQVLINAGFEEKKEYFWKGNGYDWQPENSKTINKDFVLQDRFFVKFETCMYKKTEKDEWILDTTMQCFYGEWYEKNTENPIRCFELKYFHQLQNIYFLATGKELRLNIQQ